MTVATTARALAVGDVIELVTVPPHVKGAKPGDRGRILCDQLPWNSYTVALGKMIAADPNAQPGRTYMVRGCHLRRVEGAA
ncbi:MAG TPA: hypothetical protein VII06_43180 [Chloroflexota bacterium]|jgi:hypothetical protein